jgi:histidine phosphotransfer protein HptB
MIDRSALDRLQEALGDDPADLVDLVETFLADAPDILAVMGAGVAEANLDVVRRQAHSLKSNARDLGATGLAGLCARLEGDIKDKGDPGDLGARVAAIHEEWTRIALALQEEIARLGGGK